jgi:hypothetical protein
VQVRLAVVALVVLPAFLAGAGHSGASRPSPALYGYGFDFLARLDPTTLRIEKKLRGFPVVTGQEALSPDGSRLVVGAGFMGDGTYAVADARSLRWLHKRVHVALGPGGYAGVGGFQWLRPHRVFALVEGTGPVAAGPIPWTQAAILDVGRTRVAAKRPLPGYVVATGRDGPSMVLLLIGFHSLRAWRLAVVAADGSVRTVPVRLPRARYSNYGYTAVGLAVDPRSHRAFLLPGNGRIAVVDLRHLRVRYRPWPARPAARWRSHVRSEKNHEGDPTGPMRWATWLGDGIVAVGGEDDRLQGPRFGPTVTTPYGLQLIDTRRWTSKVVAPWADRFATAEGLVLPFVGDALNEEYNPPPGSGLHAFSRDGRLLYKRYGRTAVTLSPIDDRLYVRRPGHVDVLETRTGRRITSIPFRGEGHGRLFPYFGSS